MSKQLDKVFNDLLKEYILAVIEWRTKDANKLMKAVKLVFKVKTGDNRL